MSFGKASLDRRLLTIPGRDEVSAEAPAYPPMAEN